MFLFVKKFLVVIYRWVQLLRGPSAMDGVLNGFMQIVLFLMEKIHCGSLAELNATVNDQRCLWNVSVQLGWNILFWCCQRLCYELFQSYEECCEKRRKINDSPPAASTVAENLMDLRKELCKLLFEDCPSENVEVSDYDGLYQFIVDDLMSSRESRDFAKVIKPLP